MREKREFFVLRFVVWSSILFGVRVIKSFSVAVEGEDDCNSDYCLYISLGIITTSRLLSLRLSGLLMQFIKQVKFNLHQIIRTDHFKPSII